MPELLRSVDIFEDNFGLGDHRTWSKSERAAWHQWLERNLGDEPGEPCDCGYPDA